jgi:membrane protein implicated in regulation of membrane protease activity
MPQLIILLLLVGGAVWLYRRFVGEAERQQARSERVQRERETGAAGTLVKDEETGEYRLKRDHE